MPDDELPSASELINHRRRITGLFCAERAPEFFAGIFVECDRHAAVATSETDQFLSIDERMAGEAPHRGLNLETLLEVVGPDRCAFLCVETEKISFSTKRVNFPIRNAGRDARPSTVTDRVRTIVFVLPKNFSIRFVQTQHAFGSRNFSPRESIRWRLRILRALPIHHVYSPVRHRRPAIAATDGHSPTEFQPVRRQFLDDARFAPDPIALRPQPLRPVVGKKRAAEQEYECARECKAQCEGRSFHLMEIG